MTEQLDLFYTPTYQHYWKCEHHPVAIDNYFAGLTRCGEKTCNPSPTHASTTSPPKPGTVKATQVFDPRWLTS